MSRNTSSTAIEVRYSKLQPASCLLNHSYTGCSCLASLQGLNDVFLMQSLIRTLGSLGASTQFAGSGATVQSRQSRLLCDNSAPASPEVDAVAINLPYGTVGAVNCLQHLLQQP
jgi:hypothetical protein